MTSQPGGSGPGSGSLSTGTRVAQYPGCIARLLWYVLRLSSLTQLSGWSRLVGVTTTVLSAQAWHTRLHTSSVWLLWLFAERLQLCLPMAPLPGGQHILLVDATHLPEMGAKGKDWRLHGASDVGSGALAWVRVTDQNGGERLDHFPIRPGDILVGERAYSNAPHLLTVAEAHAFSLTRFRPWHLPTPPNVASMSEGD